jgi:DNA polymerase I-like protein with 3'-5' exonuclease and polymerase domains
MFHYISTPNEVNDLLNHLITVEEIAVDTETYVLPVDEYRSINSTALDSWISDISLLILGLRNEQIYVIDFILLDEKIRYEILNLIKDKHLFFYNAPFDLMFFLNYGIKCSKVKDIFILVKLLQNATGSKFGRSTGASLGDACRDYLRVNLKGKGVEQVTDWFPRPLLQEKLEYAANDVKYLFPLYDLIYPLVTNKLPYSPVLEQTCIPHLDESDDQSIWGWAMGQVEQLEQEYCTLIAEMQDGGVTIDTLLTDKFQHEVNNTVETLAGKIAHKLGLPCGEDFLLDVLIATDSSKKTINNPAALKDLLIANEIKIDSARRADMNRILDLITNVAPPVGEDEESFLQRYTLVAESELVKMQKILTLIMTYKGLIKQQGLNLANYTHPIRDGKIRPSMNSLGTATGRQSANNPNLQQVNARLSLTVQFELDEIPSSWNVTNLGDILEAEGLNLPY